MPRASQPPARNLPLDARQSRTGTGRHGRPKGSWASAEPVATVGHKMFVTTKTQRAFRPLGGAMHARAPEKEFSFALVSMEEAKAARTGHSRGGPSTGTS